MPSAGEPGGTDPESAASVGDLAALLRRLHLEAGAPSLRELSRTDPGTRADGRAHVRLTRSTLSAALNGERLPSQDTLSALLAALGVPDAAQKSWLAARGRLERQRTAPVHSAGSDDVPAPTSRRRWLRWWPVAVLVVGSVIAGFLVLRERDHPVAATSIGCDPPDCSAVGPVLTLTGRLGRPWAADQQPHVLIRVQSTQRWYLGPAIAAGPGQAWRHEINVGNPVPQPRNRHFTICVYALPVAAVDRLVQGQLRNKGTGLPVGDLPPQRIELACTEAIRPANR